MARSDIIGKVRARAAKAVEGIVSSERGAAALSEAMRRMQKGRQVFDEKATEVASSLGIATKADVERVGRKIGKLRKTVQSLLDELDGPK